MRRLLLLICGFTLLAACSEDESLNVNERQLEEKNLVKQLNEKEQKIKELIQHIEQLNLQIDDFNMEKENFEITSKIKNEKFEIYEDSLLAENFEEDLDGDGVKETIKMYIHPSPMMDGKNEGQYFWDDSHLWQLIVFDENKTYPLFNNYLSGKLKFWIDGDEEQKTIILLQDGMELSLEKFQYDAAGYFIRKELYKSTEIPPVRSTRIQ